MHIYIYIYNIYIYIGVFECFIKSSYKSLDVVNWYVLLVLLMKKILNKMTLMQQGLQKYFMSFG